MKDDINNLEIRVLKLETYFKVFCTIFLVAGLLTFHYWGSIPEKDNMPQTAGLEHKQGVLCPSYNKDIQLFIGARESFAEKALADREIDKKATMVADSLFSQERYDEAILGYQKIISSQDTHNNKTLAYALYRQGMSFLLLHDKDTARLIYKKLESLFPEYDITRLAMVQDL